MSDLNYVAVKCGTSTIIEKYMRLYFLCQIAQCGKTLISIFRHFSASIKKKLSLEGRLGTKL